MLYLGVDFGIKRIGLAVSEGDLATPFKIMTVKNFQDGLHQIQQEAMKLAVEKIVIGLPEGEMGKLVNKLAKSLVKEGFQVEVADETLSSKKATLKMIEIGISKKKRRQIDDVAAAIILQGFLDHQ